MNEIPPYVSKIDIVTNALRSLIADGVYGPGTPLRQRELAARLGVSVTPVREALRRLESEGIVSFDPHVGVRVVQVDFGPTEENFHIRASLESLAAAMAAERIAPAEIDRLERILEEMQRTPIGAARLTQLNRDFHFLIYDQSAAPLLISMIRRLWLSFGGGPVLKSHADESRQQHEEIIAALRAHDAKRAETATREHILTGMERWAGLENGRRRSRRDLNKS